MNLGMQLKSPTVHGTYKKKCYSFIHSFADSLIHLFNGACTHPCAGGSHPMLGMGQQQDELAKEKSLVSSLTLSVEPAVKP